MLRFGVNTNDLMVNIVTSYNDINKLSPLIDTLLKEFPEITSMVNNVNTRKADVAFGEYVTLLYGEPFIREKLGKLTFEISANSFFQTNTKQGEALYNEVSKLIGLTGEEIVYDLYSGIGTISLFLSKEAKKIIGIETVKDAVQAAKSNSKLNNISNCKFIHGDVKDIIGNPIKGIKKPDIIIVDPPRNGLEKSVIKSIIKLSPDKIIYVSCNSSTQARDIYELRDFYNLKITQAIDMFPQTYHVENVVLLEKI